MHHAPNTGKCQKATVSGDTNEVFSGVPLHGTSGIYPSTALSIAVHSCCPKKPTCHSKDSTDSIMEPTTNTMYVVPPMFIVGTNPQHTMTKQKQDKSHGNQGNYHNDVELQTWCTHVLATVNRNICSKLCDVHIMLL